MTDQIPPTPVQPARRSLMDRVSIVWVIPIGALLIALGIAWQSWIDRGALIEIEFRNAAGIVAEQTELRFRDVSVGVVEELGFADDLSHVVASVRLDKQVEPFVDSKATFWIVRPEVSARGITGLDTVLSGVYIEGSWDDNPEGLQHTFLGKDDIPLSGPNQKGRQIVLRTRTGRGLSEGAPILYKGIEVGRIGKPRLAGDGVSVEAQAFVDEPHDQLMSTRSRFWNTSGISFSLGASGASVDFESMSSLITGGVSFETVVSGGDLVDDGTLFVVHENQDAARESLFDGSVASERLQLAVVFEENVSGLTVGAPVTLRGLEIGEVAGLSGKVDEELFGDSGVRLIVVLSIGLEHLQLGEGTETAEILDFFEQAVAENWRARLTKASFLTGGLKIELVQVPDAEPAVFQRDAEPYPIMPTVTAEIPAMSATAEGLLNRVNDLPVEDLLASAIAFMDNAAALVASDDLQQTPAELRGLIGDIRNVVSSADLQALPQKIDGISDGIQTALDTLTEREGITKLVEAIETTQETAAGIGNAVEGIPDLVDRIEELALKAEALALEEFLDHLTDMAESAGLILNDGDTRALPERISSALAGVTTAVEEASLLFTDLNETDAATIMSDAVIAAGQAAEDVSEAVGEVPALVEKIDTVVANVAAIELDKLAGQITELVGSAETLIATEGAQALPEQLGGALDEVSAVLAELRGGGTVASVNSALDSARLAAQSVATASAELPDLVNRTERVLREAEAALASVSESGALNREARAAMREVSRAADAVRSLARTIERKPNAFVTGK